LIFHLKSKPIRWKNHLNIYTHFSQKELGLFFFPTKENGDDQGILTLTLCLLKVKGKPSFFHPHHKVFIVFVCVFAPNNHIIIWIYNALFCSSLEEKIDWSQTALVVEPITEVVSAPNPHVATIIVPNLYQQSLQMALGLYQQPLHF